jgi:rubrerythrin
MSTLTSQCNELRLTAVKLERMMRGKFDAISLSSIPPTLRHAAYTIESLSNRLAETCHDVSEPPEDGVFWPTPHFRCSECGATHVSLEYVNYCPKCGRRVVE